VEVVATALAAAAMGEGMVVASEVVWPVCTLPSSDSGMCDRSEGHGQGSDTVARRTCRMSWGQS
jgi:hypothetical protein